ncbi:hypothetical protein SAMN05421665_0538 [Yoonia rosea]|uniref:Uncharacterized protein n=1 Tax=Yoonia rosea TaxID=287098 RepID=A0A1R3WHH7_9RHOB|nr:hypothetical protein [Yoonia rosea]SIT77292.1 hypothetical protein SAMN05421665_0538 [Yoonia rosea]
MPNQSTQRYCADPEALAALKRDGLGWGHDLECGCFYDSPRRKSGPFARLIAAFQRRT